MKSGDVYGGFFLKFEPRRSTKIEAELHYRAQASESFSAMDWDFEPRELVLLGLEPDSPSIAGIALMERMHGSGGTGKLRMRIDSPVMFTQPIEVESIPKGIDLARLQSTAERPRRIPGKTWDSLISEIQRIRPQHAASIRELIRARTKQRILLGKDNRSVTLAEQRDAVGLALKVAAIDHAPILKSLDIKKLDSTNTVLELLDNEPLHEQDAIRHDERIFGRLLDDSMQGAKFAGRGHEVRVYVSDKKRLETILGIDLLIYQQAYNSFVLLQYKRMSPLQMDTGNSWSYLADHQLDKQMVAASDAQAAIDKMSAANSRTLWDWRLNASPFYFKFCETTRPTARDDSLIRGITLGLSHLYDFLALPSSQGSGGGRRIGYHNCPRYLSNTQFVDLVSEGWLGCDANGVDYISELIAQSGETRLPILASIDGERRPDARGRGRHKRA